MTASPASGGSELPDAPSRAAEWDERSLANPHANEDKAGRVRRMFAAIAGSYDLNNRVHSLGMDQRWRKFAVKVASVREGDEVLDVACGTGDLTQAFAKTKAKRVVGADFTPAMLDVARVKQRSLRPDQGGKITYEDGDAMALRYADESFDVVSIAFGIRNVSAPETAFKEFARVLRPGGRLVVLEFEPPRNPLIRWFNGVYCAKVMPRTATLISGDTSGAYKYLPASVETFMDRGQLARAMEAAGFAQIQSKSLSLGICVCTWGVRTDSADAR